MANISLGYGALKLSFNSLACANISMRCSLVKLSHGSWGVTIALSGKRGRHESSGIVVWMCQVITCCL